MKDWMPTLRSLIVIGAMATLAPLAAVQAHAETGSVTCKRGSCEVVCNAARVDARCIRELPNCGCASGGKGGSIAFRCELSSCSRSCDKDKPRGGCYGPHLKTRAKCYCG